MENKMSKKIASIITDNNITVNFDGQTHIISRKDSLANDLIRALKEGRRDEIPNLITAAKRVETFGKGHFTVDKGRILVNGQEVPEFLSRKITSFLSEGLPHQPLVRFAENLIKNPSYRAVQELFQFLEMNNHPLTDNGCFIAYKKVRADFKDQHSGTFDNSPGKTVEMPRNQVNEDPTQTCSYGLHVANWDYAHNHYSAGEDPIMLEVEVNPADVVAVPVDYNQSKMRVCRYLVLGEVREELDKEMPYRKTLPSIDADELCSQCRVYCYGVDLDGLCEECREENQVLDEVCPECEEEDCYEFECLERENDVYPWEDEIE
jgi:hypothetical protein